MKAPYYTAYAGSFSIVVSTPRSQKAPSHKFEYASIHEDYCAKVRVALREYRHCGAVAETQPAARRITTYLPGVGGQALYALRELKPEGADRAVDPQFMLEVMVMRWSFSLHLTSAALIADPEIAEAIERHLELALRKLFQALGIPDEFIAGDEEQRPGIRTDISIIVNLGGATARTTVELPAAV